MTTMMHTAKKGILRVDVPLSKDLVQLRETLRGIRSFVEKLHHQPETILAR